MRFLINKDPYTDLFNCYERLKEEYKKYNSLVVAVDFDNTLYDYHKKEFTFDKVIWILKKCKEFGCKIVIFSGSAKERYPFIQDYCNEIGVQIDAINEDVITWHNDPHLDWSRSKIYYNILLDDRAGLGQACMCLELLICNLTQEKKYFDLS